MKPWLSWLVYAAIIGLGTLVTTIFLAIFGVRYGAALATTIARTPVNLLVLLVATGFLCRSQPKASTTQLWIGSALTLLVCPTFWTGNHLFGRLLTSNIILINVIDGIVWLVVSYVAIRLVSLTPARKDPS